MTVAASTVARSANARPIAAIGDAMSGEGSPGAHDP